MTSIQFIWKPRIHPFGHYQKHLSMRTDVVLHPLHRIASQNSSQSTIKDQLIDNDDIKKRKNTNAKVDQDAVIFVDPLG